MFRYMRRLWKVRVKQVEVWPRLDVGREYSLGCSIPVAVSTPHQLERRLQGYVASVILGHAVYSVSSSLLYLQTYDNNMMI